MFIQGKFILDKTSWINLVNSVDPETAERSPKTGVRAYARTPVFGYLLNFREVLII
jgi:hypothetical protein